MSDRREAVAKALYEADPSVDIHGQDVPWEGDRYFDTKQLIRQMADAAIAAMDAAEPTDAEIDAAADEICELPITFETSRTLARAAIIAARKAGASS